MLRISPGTGTTPVTTTALSLNHLATRLIAGVESRCRQKRSCIVNDIHPEIKFVADSQVLSSLVGSLLDEILTLGYDDHIQLSAKSFGYITLLHLRNNNCYENDMAGFLQSIQPMAETLGGCLGITHNRLYGTTVALTFVNRVTMQDAMTDGR